MAAAPNMARPVLGGAVHNSQPTYQAIISTNRSTPPNVAPTASGSLAIDPAKLPNPRPKASAASHTTGIDAEAT